MSFAADICKNAVVTDCLVLKDKKAFPRQWNARESLFEPRKDSGFQVRDLYLSLCLSHARTQMQYLYQDDCLIIWWSKLWCLRQRKRQKDSVCWRWEWGGLQIETSSLSSPRALPFSSRTHACRHVRLSSPFQVIRWDFTLSGLNWLCHGLGVVIRFWMGSQLMSTF